MAVSSLITSLRLHLRTVSAHAVMVIRNNSPVSPVVDQSAVTSSDIALGDDGDQPPAVDEVEGRQDSDDNIRHTGGNNDEDDFSAGIPKLRLLEFQRLEGMRTHGGA